MCIFRVKKYIHANGRRESIPELVPCRFSDGKIPCPNTQRREELITVGGSTITSPGSLTPGQGTVSPASSSFPHTPRADSVISGGGFDVREPSKGSPSRSSTSGGRSRRYHIILDPAPRPRASKRRGREMQESSPPRPLLSTPNPSGLARVPLPPGVSRALPHRRVHSDSELNELGGSPVDDEAYAPEIIGRSAARERLRQEALASRLLEDEENERLRTESAERDRIHAAVRRAKEAEERLLDDQERRTEARLRFREEMREEERQRRAMSDATTQREARQRLADEARRSREHEEQEQVDRIRRGLQEERNHEAIERQRHEELKLREIRETREREDREREDLRRQMRNERAQREADARRRSEEARGHQKDSDHLRAEERRLRDIDASIARREREAEASLRARERDAELRHNILAMQEVENQLAALDDERERGGRLRQSVNDMRLAQREYEDNYRRLPSRGRNERRVDFDLPEQIDGPRHGERPSIMPPPPPQLTPTRPWEIRRQDPVSPFENADFRRQRGEEVLEAARRAAAARAQREEELDLSPRISRRATIGGGGRARETAYRGNLRRYPP
jgi:hypothetical protein